ncbi:four helix bundle protein [Flavobacterium branchiarum]|uniref:Four helix bundle protein n=1 Tax=Flavobacterium branchiarum TaxID=1114870 RepID=A0ABV5FRW9_9FLAO|nr:four helix bundle protein [Flavobacterium branchiarum]MDN3673406.1 four helix bundle protein [Flavobacterium branchiarum]
MNENKDVIKSKSFSFAIRIVNFYKILNSRGEYVMSKQILRSGTSIGANIREAKNAESKADFIHKMGISQKEADETLYWLELLHATDYISQEEFLSMNNDGIEVLKLVKSIIISAKSNLKKT